MLQKQKVEHSFLKKIFTEKYRWRVTKILNTKLSARNQSTELNTWAIPVLTYSFGIIKWTETDHEAVYRLTRRLLTKFRCLNPKSYIILYLPCKERQRGLVSNSQTDCHEVQYKLLDGNTPPYCRYMSEPVLEAANVILYGDGFIITDKSVDFNRPDKVFIDRE